MTEGKWKNKYQNNKPKEEEDAQVGQGISTGMNRWRDREETRKIE